MFFIEEARGLWSSWMGSLGKGRKETFRAECLMEVGGEREQTTTTKIMLSEHVGPWQTQTSGSDVHHVWHVVLWIPYSFSPMKSSISLYHPMIIFARWAEAVEDYLGKLKEVLNSAYRLAQGWKEKRQALRSKSNRGGWIARGLFKFKFLHLLPLQAYWAEPSLGGTREYGELKAVLVICVEPWVNQFIASGFTWMTS